MEKKGLDAFFEKRKKLLRHFEKAGFEKEQVPGIHRNIFLTALFFTIMTAVLFFFYYLQGEYITYIIVMLLIFLIFGLGIISFIFAGIFYIYLDMKIYWRRKQVEKVLPEFLLLTSSNMKAGMLIDQALLYAIRPKFGILAKEIEIVIKDVIAGKDITEALERFSNKYDSELLDRSINLMNEGIRSGGRMAKILNKISINLSEIALQKKEMGASVTTYIIFISFASVGAAPVLLALARQLLDVIKKLISTLASSSTDSGGMSFLDFTVPELTGTDFSIFAVCMLMVSSLFSSMIISTIKKGDAKQGLKYIPIFMIVSITLYFLSNMVMSNLFGGMFSF
ncbi:MAG: type II secretion system F family protein [Nanobdellota archaeon]